MATEDKRLLYNFHEKFDVVPLDAILLKPLWSARVEVAFTNGVPAAKGKILIFDEAGKYVKEVDCAIVSKTKGAEV